MPKPYRPIVALAVLLPSLAATGCASHREAATPPMTQAQQKLQEMADDPSLPQTARAAAQQGVDEGQAKQMMEQGK